ncbi:MAG: efflux RND transporter periplasmic adaptor subunit [Acidobacteriota bacterium]
MRYLKVILPFVLLLGAVFGAGLLADAGPKLPPGESVDPVRRVEAVAAAPQELVLDVTAFGTLELRSDIDVTASVAAPISRLSPSLEAGNLVRRGDVLARLETVDFEMARAQAASAIADAELRLAQEEAEARIALEEWTGDGEPGPLVSRRPQLQQARARLEAVRAELQQAEVNLGRAVIRAPFDALVRERRVGLGQYLQPGQVIARLQEADVAEVRVPLTEAQLAALDPSILRPSAQNDGPTALVSARIAGLEVVRRGRVLRTEGALDAASRMLTLVVEVRDPLALRSDGEPLVPGQFVDVTIAGRRVPEATIVPRAALIDGDRVFVIDGGELRRRRVDVIQVRGEHAVIGGGLAAGELVNISPALGALDGTPVEARRIEGPAAEALGLKASFGSSPDTARPGAAGANAGPSDAAS